MVPEPIFQPGLLHEQLGAIFSLAECMIFSGPASDFAWVLV